MSDKEPVQWEGDRKEDDGMTHKDNTKKPTIEELEAIMADDSYDSIQILPDGSIEAYRSVDGVRTDAKVKIVSLGKALSDSY